jgi:hypothetical protein
MRMRLLVILWVAVAPAACAESWKAQYFYDQDRETLAINDLICPSARRCIATGRIEPEKGSPRPTAVVTSDGGAHWALAPLKEPAVSLFLLDDSTGWMVGAKNLWKTVEGGRSWERVARLPQGVLRVHFLSAEHGFAVGTRKSVYETTDGGARWEPLAAAAEPKTSLEYTTYTWVEFVGGKHGVISGFSRPPRKDATLPDWVDPQSAATRRQWPTVSITLDTHDGGKSWTSSAASLFGQISRVRLAPDGVGLGLIMFTDNFEWPSEVFRVDWKNGTSGRVFRDHNRRITDVAILSDKLAYLAGEEVPAKFHQTPIPGKLKIYKSVDLRSWTEMEVDYRATAAVALLSAADERNIWAATDTGMILKLEP